ncbi:hypothetical protein FB451DRAFT_678936 [Mycena latifolia]|nr:hypothetical protein FB451DRAFT_678936 [Mycena latifolia]
MGPNSTISQLHFLQCSRTLVPQQGTIDSQSGQLNGLSLEPNVFKTHSMWNPYEDIDLHPSQQETLLDSSMWPNVLFGLQSDIGETAGLINNGASEDVSVADEFLMNYLKLDPSWMASFAANTTELVLNLHDIENSISALLATIFWLGGHISPDRLNNKYGGSDSKIQTLVQPVLGFTSTTIQQKTTVAHLQINLSAVSTGLGIAMIITLLCITLLPAASKQKIQVSGSGLLHLMWLNQCHPDLVDLLQNVENPTEQRLRSVGLIPVEFSHKQHSLILEPTSTHTAELKQSPISSQPTGGHKSFWNTSPISLRIISIALHISLVLLHLSLLGLWAAPHLEHQVVFSIDLQGSVSLWVTVIATSFATIYLSITLYVTQKLATHSDLCNKQTLTSTHDNHLSWSGSGSALFTLYKQFRLPASVLGPFIIFCYLCTVSVLHVTTSALLTVESFNISVPSTVPTTGFPEWPGSDHNETISFIDQMVVFLPWIGNLEESKTLGLFNGSLYEVLSTTNPEYGNTTVSAVGFNITCGYLSGVNTEIQDTEADWAGWMNISFGSSLGSHTIDPIQPFAPNIITTGSINDELTPEDPELWSSIILYTANKVVDSYGNTGFPVSLINATGPNSSITDIQFLQCSMHSVSQHGEVDGKSGNIIPSSLQPSVFKNHSKWYQFMEDPEHEGNINETLLDSGLWAEMIINSGGESSVPGSYDTGEGNYLLSWPDVYLIEHLGLDPISAVTNISLTPGPTLYVHDIENALSALVASLFWIAGHIHPTPLAMKYGSNSVQDTGDSAMQPPILSASNATLYQDVSGARLNLDIYAISVGLGASIILFALGIKFWHIRGHLEPRLEGIGLLHIMWLTQKHPEVLDQLKQVDEPTDNNLRTVGMIKVQLLGVQVELQDTT